MHTFKIQLAYLCDIKLHLQCSTFIELSRRQFHIYIQHLRKS